ncbi:UNVERIFIED_CONTAM: hypothetical protein HDU68_002458 [Siphonaria sp. JEL0065]|nr:hypothetical protein HDU68_002458 [Siphonaria sp. JEL0065]
MPESAYQQLVDTESIREAGNDVHELLPTSLMLTHKGDTIVFANKTDTPVFTLSIPDIPDIWYTKSTKSLLLDPPTLQTFDQVSPDLILSNATGAVVASLSPYKHDVRRYGYKMTTQTKLEIENSFPLDEGRNVYGIGLFTTHLGKYQWLANEFINGITPQDPMSTKQETIQFKLYFTKATKHANATNEAGKFMNSFLSGNTLGSGIARKVVATFACNKNMSGVGGVLEHKGEWADEEEAALVAASAVSALLAYKYRVQRYQHKKLKGEFY